MTRGLFYGDSGRYTVRLVTNSIYFDNRTRPPRLSPIPAQRFVFLSLKSLFFKSNYMCVPVCLSVFFFTLLTVLIYFRVCVCVCVRACLYVCLSVFFFVVFIFYLCVCARTHTCMCVCAVCLFFFVIFLYVCTCLSVRLTSPFF